MSTHVSPSTAHVARAPQAQSARRERASINTGWRFSRFTSNPDSLSYSTLKPWMLLAANEFIGTKHGQPSGTAPGANVQYVQSNFDDSAWENVDLPHDWAIKGPFDAPNVDGGQGRLPINGDGWYRRRLNIDAEVIISGKSIFLDIGGAQAYAAVWLNGKLIGGWPYGYNSFRLNLTPSATSGNNTLVIRLVNSLQASRWYPGAGLYRNVWLVTTNQVHVGQYGTFVTTPSVSVQSAAVNLLAQVQNDGSKSQEVDVVSKIYALDASSRKPTGDAIATFASQKATLAVAHTSAHWKPELAIAHILPHWTWPDRVGQVTPVHVFTSGDEAELFVNGVSAGRQKRGQYQYHLRWDNVTYAAGSIKVVACKNGAQWATDEQKTAGSATGFTITADRTTIRGDGDELSYVSITVVDKDGIKVPQATNEVTFSVSSGPGKIVSTNNEDPTDKTAFPSLSRKAFSGNALAIVKANAGSSGDIVIEAKANGLTSAKITIKAA